MLLLFALAAPILLARGLFAKACRSVLERQAAEERKPLEQAITQVPLVNVQAPLDFVPPITILVTDSQGHQLRVVVDEHGQQHAEPVLNLN